MTTARSRFWMSTRLSSLLTISTRALRAPPCSSRSTPVATLTISVSNSCVLARPPAPAVRPTYLRAWMWRISHSVGGSSDTGARRVTLLASTQSSSGLLLAPTVPGQLPQVSQLAQLYHSVQLRPHYPQRSTARARGAADLPSAWPCGRSRRPAGPSHAAGPCGSASRRGLRLRRSGCRRRRARASAS